MFFEKCYFHLVEVKPAFVLRVLFKLSSIIIPNSCLRECGTMVDDLIAEPNLATQSANTLSLQKMCWNIISSSKTLEKIVYTLYQWSNMSRDSTNILNCLDNSKIIAFNLDTLKLASKAADNP